MIYSSACVYAHSARRWRRAHARSEPTRTADNPRHIRATVADPRSSFHVVAEQAMTLRGLVANGQAEVGGQRF
jgi:hypothetical protein